MWKFIFVGLVGFALCGCSSLENKEVIVDTSVQGFKVTTGADASSGTPLPNISAGWGSNLLITLPTDEDGTLEYNKETGSFFGSIFGINVTDKTSIRVTTGSSVIKVTTQTGEDKEVTTEVGGGTVKVKVKDTDVVTIP